MSDRTLFQHTTEVIQDGSDVPGSKCPGVDYVRRYQVEPSFRLPGISLLETPYIENNSSLAPLVP